MATTARSPPCTGYHDDVDPCRLPTMHHDPEPASASATRCNLTPAAPTPRRRLHVPLRLPRDSRTKRNDVPAARRAEQARGDGPRWSGELTFVSHCGGLTPLRRGIPLFPSVYLLQNRWCWSIVLVRMTSTRGWIRIYDQRQRKMLGRTSPTNYELLFAWEGFLVRGGGLL
jgi:hypothetical protein